MKTIRTILGTLAVVLLGYSLLAWLSVGQEAAFVQRTIYQAFRETRAITLIIGGAFLLIAIILTIGIVLIRDDEEAGGEDEDEEDEEEEAEKDEDDILADAASADAAPVAAAPVRAYRRPVRDMSGDLFSEEQGPVKASQDSYEKPVKEKPALRKDPLVKPIPEEPVYKEPVPAELAQKEPAQKEPVYKEPSIENAEQEPESPVILAASPEEDGDREDAFRRCIYCGNKVSKNSLFCPQCGKKL